MASRSGRADAPPRDLIIGLVAPMGVDCKPVYDALADELRIVRYDAVRIKISERLTKYLNEANPAILAGATYLQRKKVLMDAGNIFRHLWVSGDALALLAMSQIGAERESAEDESRGRAYVIDSLKHPSEIELLKAVYGPAFIAVGVYAPPSIRFEYIEGQRTLLRDVERSLMQHLVARDQDEEDKLGQRVRAAFELTDVVIDSRHSEVNQQVRRLVEILFGSKLRTPTTAEYGMAVAHAARARSGSLARQIGAAVLRADGSVVSVGHNDVARPGGGQYDESDDAEFPRGRDIRRGEDSSDWFRKRALSDVIRLLQENGIIRERTDPEELFRRWYISSKRKSDPPAFLRQALLMNTIDYIRAVHAEVAALLDAARNGVAVTGATIYTTTFPCHDCAKAIIAAGVREVIYWAPYPKSLVDDLYDDSIDVDAPDPDPKKLHFHSFVGVAPNRYPDFFIMGKRERKSDGKAEVFDANRAVLTLPDYTVSEALSRLDENEKTKTFLKKMRSSKATLLKRLRAIKRTDEKQARRASRRR